MNVGILTKDKLMNVIASTNSGFTGMHYVVSSTDGIDNVISAARSGLAIDNGVGAVGSSGMVAFARLGSSSGGIGRNSPIIASCISSHCRRNVLVNCIAGVRGGSGGLAGSNAVAPIMSFRRVRGIVIVARLGRANSAGATSSARDARATNSDRARGSARGGWKTT